MKITTNIIEFLGWLTGLSIGFTCLYFAIARVFGKNKATKENRNSYSDVHGVMTMIFAYGVCYFVLMLIVNGLKYHLGLACTGTAKEVVTNTTAFAMLIPEFGAKGLYGIITRKKDKECFVALDKNIETFVSCVTVISCSITLCYMGLISTGINLFVTKFLVTVVKKAMAIHQARVAKENVTWCLKNISPLVAIVTAMIQVVFVSVLFATHMSLAIMYAMCFALVLALFIWAIATNVIATNEKEHKSIIKAVTRAIKYNRKKRKEKKEEETMEEIPVPLPTPPKKK